LKRSPFNLQTFSFSIEKRQNTQTTSAGRSSQLQSGAIRDEPGSSALINKGPAGVSAYGLNHSPLTQETTQSDEMNAANFCRNLGMKSGFHFPKLQRASNGIDGVRSPASNRNLNPKRLVIGPSKKVSTFLRLDWKEFALRRDV